MRQPLQCLRRSRSAITLSLMPSYECAIARGQVDRNFWPSRRQDGHLPSWCGRCIKRAYRQAHFESFGKILATFSKNAIGCHVFGRHPMLANGGQNASKPGKRRGKLTWQCYLAVIPPGVAGGVSIHESFGPCPNLRRHNPGEEPCGST